MPWQAADVPAEGRVEGKGSHLAPAGAAGQQVGVEVEEAPGLCGEEYCGGGDHVGRAAAGVAGAAEGAE